MANKILEKKQTIIMDKKIKIQVKKTVETSIEKYLFDIKEYEIVDIGQRGAFGLINFVKNKSTGKRYATKTNLIQSGEQNQKFILREIGILINVQHPTIIQFQGLSFQDFKGEDNITILMDYKENGSLAEILSKEMDSLCPHSYDNTKRQIILVGIARGMMLLHSHNVIHRDLKPENVLLDKDYNPCITDFGLSKFFDPDYSKKQSMANCGSIAYMAPEVILSNEFNIKADVYAFGILMYELLSGVRAYKDIFSKKSFTVFSFHSKIVNGYRPQFTIPIKSSFKKLIEKCWSQNINERPTFPELFKKLSLQDKSDTENYCLDNVDVDELSLYVDDIMCNASANDDFENDEITKLKEEIKKLRGQNEKVQSELDEKDEKIKSLKKKNAALKKQNVKINANYNETIDKLQEENINYKKTIDKLQEENINYKKTIDKLHEENEQQKKIIIDLKDDDSINIPSYTFNKKRKEVDSIWESGQTHSPSEGDYNSGLDPDVLEENQQLNNNNNIAKQLNKEPKIVGRKYKRTNSQNGEFKIFVTGHYYSGKTSIVQQLVRGQLPTVSYITPVPMEYTTKYKNCINLSVWDTAGSEELLSMNVTSFHGSDAILWVCSYDNENAYSDFKNLHQKYISSYSQNIPIFLVINKSDLDKSMKKLSDDDVEKLRKDLFFEDSFIISAKNHDQIIEVFDNVINTLLNLFPLSFLAKNENDDSSQNTNTQCQIQ